MIPLAIHPVIPPGALFPRLLGSAAGGSAAGSGAPEGVVGWGMQSDEVHGVGVSDGVGERGAEGADVVESRRGGRCGAGVGAGGY